MNHLYNLCIIELNDGTYKKINRILKGYEMAVDDGDANENDYKDVFHLVIENAIEKFEGSKDKNKNFAAWICQTILGYYGHHVPVKDETRLRFNAFITKHYVPSDLSATVLAALYAHQFESLPQIFKNHIDSDVSEPPIPNLFEAVKHVQVYAGMVTGDLRVKLMGILEKNLLKCIPKDDQNTRSYENLINDIKNIDLSCPTEAPKKSYRNRLMLGEANFTYTVAVLKKHANTHPNLGASITSTEFLSKQQLKSVYKDSVIKNIDYIKSLGGTVYASTDAQLINTYKFPHKRYHRIHFNMPYDTGSFKNRTLPPILKAFFLAAREIQNVHDRIHMALPVPDNMDFRHAYVYDIYEASARAGYQLVKKRHFDGIRYPGYKHSITNVAGSASITEEGIREFIFEKTNYSYENLLEISPPRKKWIFYDKKEYNYHKHIDTDSGSSDYLTDEEPVKAATLKK